MPTVTFHKQGQTFTDEVKPQTNLVVRAASASSPTPTCATSAAWASAPSAHAA